MERSFVRKSQRELRLHISPSETISQAPAVGAEIAHVTASVEAQPERFLAYCKGDQNMAGDYIRCHGMPRLFDFNAGGYRHALIEGMRCPDGSYAVYGTTSKSINWVASPRFADWSFTFT